MGSDDDDLLEEGPPGGALPPAPPLLAPLPRDECELARRNGAGNKKHGWQGGSPLPVPLFPVLALVALPLDSCAPILPFILFQIRRWLLYKNGKEVSSFD